MNHYVYMLINSKDGRKYIGVRSCTCSIDKDAYMGSSSETKEYIDDCIKVILKEFDTREEAAKFEILLHELHDVATNPEFFNRAKSTSTAFSTAGNRDVAMKIALTQLGEKNSMYGKRGKLSPNYGRKASEVTKEKIRQARVGTKASKETKDKMSMQRRGSNNSKAKVADVYCYYTNTIIASGVCLSEWSKQNGLGKGLIGTASGGRKSHKGMYARYRKG